MHKGETPQVNVNFIIIGTRQENLSAIYDVKGKNIW